jgi:glycosyltransferase involved in cell wall biosynthesis
VKIIQISDGVTEIKIPPSRGGAIIGHIAFMSKYLAKKGHSVIILDRLYSPDQPLVESIEGVQIIRFRAEQFDLTRFRSLNVVFSFVYQLQTYILNRFLFINQVAKYLRESEDTFDVINVYDIFSLFFLLVLTFNLRKKIFYTHCSSEWPNSSGGIAIRVTALISTLSFRLIGGVIVQNKFTYTKFSTQAKLNVFLISPGVDTTVFTPEIETRNIKVKYGLNGKKTVLFVGKITRVKGVESLIRAANIIVNNFRFKRVLFLLVGPYEQFEINKPVSNYVKKIINMVDSLDLIENVKLTGYIPFDDVRRLMVACEVFVSPSLVENFGQVITEAMACGKPIIATKTAGALMQITDGYNGFLVEPANEVQLAERILYLLERPRISRKMGINARKIAKKFDWNCVVNSYLEAYKSVSVYSACSHKN